MMFMFVRETFAKDILTPLTKHAGNLRLHTHEPPDMIRIILEPAV